MPEKNTNPLDGVEAIARLARVLTQFGIVDGTETLLEESVQPETCMREARTSIHFMGFGGRKWRDEPWLREHLTRLERRDGEARFIIGNAADTQGNAVLANLMHEFPGIFEARLMKERVLFRLVIIDRRKMLISHYGHEVIMKDGSNAMGWHSPQLVVELGSEWSLMYPFLMYYKEVWERSEPLVRPNELDGSRSRRTFS